MSFVKNASLAENVWVAHGACVVGQVEIGADSSVWYNAVIRGDENRVTIGKGTNIQDNTVIHADHGFPCSIGNGTTVGHNAIVHGCTVGDNTVIGMGATIMNGSRIGDNCIIGAGSLVTQGTVIPDGMMAFGRPAKVVRPLTDQEIKGNRKNGDDYIHLKNVHEKLA